MFNQSHDFIIQNSSFHHYRIGISHGFELLINAVAPNAFHDSDDRPDPPKCDDKTRLAVIEKILDWVTGKIDTDALFLWLYGPVGCGKSAVARTVAELCEKRKLLLASFFFFRDSEGRNAVKSVVACIAYSVALTVPAAKPLIEHVVETNPLIFQYALEVQLTKLVIEPLQRLHDHGHFDEENPLPPLIIIDGLDECLDERAQVKLINDIAFTLKQYPLCVKVLITSRPEEHIKFAIDSFEPSLISHLQLNDNFMLKPDEDISISVPDKFNEMGQKLQNHPIRVQTLTSWPNGYQTLTRKTASLDLRRPADLPFSEYKYEVLDCLWSRAVGGPSWPELRAGQCTCCPSCRISTGTSLTNSPHQRVDDRERLAALAFITFSIPWTIAMARVARIPRLRQHSSPLFSAHSPLLLPQLLNRTRIPRKYPRGVLLSLLPFSYSLAAVICASSPSAPHG